MAASVAIESMNNPKPSLDDLRIERRAPARGGSRLWVWILLILLVLLGLAAFSPSLFYKIRQQETEQYGIVLQPSIEMFSGPGENYQVLAKVHEGVKFEIVERRGEWLSVKLANGKGGYVRAAQLGKV